MNVDVVVLDNKSYIEVDRISIKGSVYAYLVNSIDKKDFCIRKIVSEKGSIYYYGLLDKETFDLALMYFTKKHENILLDDE